MKNTPMFRRLLMVVVPAVLGISVVSATPATAVCPLVGTETTCGLFINIDANGFATISTGSANFYDSGGGGGGDDRMVGIQNNSSGTIFSIYVTGTNIFAFETSPNDSPCSTSETPHATGCVGTTGNARYEGPNITFSILNANAGTITFTGGLAPGAATTTSNFFWAFEGTTAASGITVFAPEPATFGLVGLALAGLGALRFRKRKV